MKSSFCGLSSTSKRIFEDALEGLRIRSKRSINRGESRKWGKKDIVKGPSGVRKWSILSCRSVEYPVNLRYCPELPQG